MNDKIYDIIIIGSGPAGLTAAIYSAQAGLNIALITGEQFGGNLTKINNLTNYMGFSGIPGTELIDKIQAQLNCYNNIQIIYDKFLEYTLQDDGIHALTLEYSSAIIKSKSVIVATGLIPNTLELPEQKKFFGKGISFCATCDGPFFKDKDVAVIGGGNSAVEYATTLAKYCKTVSIIYRRDSLKACKAMSDLLFKYSNINVYYNCIVDSIATIDNKFAKIIIKQSNGLEWSLECACMFYALGYKKPDYSFLLNPGIFIAGDLVQEVHQVSVASGSGCVAALKAIQYLKQL